MDLLPSELLVQIFRYLDGTDVLELRGVCKRFKNCLFEHHDRLQRKSLGADPPREDDEYGWDDYDHPVHFRLVFCRSNRTVSVERRYREWPLKFQMKWEEFSGLYRHVSIRNFPTIVVFSRTLDDGVVEMLHLLEYRWNEEAKLVLKVNDMQVDRSAFRRLVNHMQVFSVDLCGLFERSFISNTLFAGTRVQSFTLCAKKGEASNIGVDFLEPFFENWIYYQTLRDYSRFRGIVENFSEESVALELPHLCLDDRHMIKFERMLVVYFRSLGRLENANRFWHKSPVIRIYDVSILRIARIMAWSEKKTACPDYTVSHNAYASVAVTTDGVTFVFTNASETQEFHLILHAQSDGRTQKYPSVERLKRLPDGEYPAVSLKEPAPAEENEGDSGKGLLHPEHVPYEVPYFSSSKEVSRVAAPRTFLERKVLERKLNNLRNDDEERRAYRSFREEQERKYREEHGIELKEETPPVVFSPTGSYSDPDDESENGCECSLCLHMSPSQKRDWDSDSGDESGCECSLCQHVSPPRKRGREERDSESESEAED